MENNEKLKSASPEEKKNTSADTSSKSEKIKGIFENAETKGQQTAPKIQQEMMNKPAFKAQEGAPKQTSTLQTSSPILTKKIASTTVTSGSFIYIFLGLITGVILALFLLISYVVSQNNLSLLSQLGITEGAIPGIIRSIHIFFIFILLIFLISIFISGAMHVNAPKGSLKHTKTMKSLIFSSIFFVITIFTYIPAFSMLANVQTSSAFKFSDYIKVAPTPTVDSAPFQVSFDASGLQELQPNIFCQWDFGDATPQSSGCTIRHTYEKTGIFSVSLIVKDGTGKEQVIPTGIVVTVNNAKPNAVLSVDITEGFAPLKVNFDASRSEDKNGVIEEYRWDFGDQYAEVNEVQGIQSSHTFSTPGTYTVTLTLIDNNNDSVSTKQTILVLETEEGILPKILATPVQGNAPLTVDFNASGTTHVKPNRSIQSYEWNFGDGSVASKGKLAKHTYSKEGTYIATLTVKDDANMSAQATVEINVGQQSSIPQAAITVIPQSLTGSAPLSATFDASGSTDADGSITNYEWTITGTDIKEYGETFQYTFNTEGEYIVNLAVTDNDENRGSNSVTMTVTSSGPKNPIASLTTIPSPPEGVKPVIIQFDASNSNDPDGSIIAYVWNFGDGTPISQTSSPKTSHKFEVVGVWTVTLTVHDDTGSTGTTKVTVAVNSAKPNAQITASTTNGTASLPINFSGTGSTGTITSYDWTFGDGTSASGPEISHTFNTPGTYTITLIVSNNVGLTDTDTVSVNISQ